MPKQLLRFCIIIFCLCAVGSSLINYQTASAAKSMRELSLLDNTTLQHIDWVTILNQVPQYQRPELEATPVSKPIETEAQISDSQIIGILVDKSNSVLIYVNQPDSLEPLKLKVGEGWLPNWQIKQINPDSVLWVNIENQESFTQMLFKETSNAATTPVTPKKNKKSGIK